jgi:phenylpropionate dioxygenase-like ring-hydroxylating dioxygenase large terminal subunit
VEAIGQAGEYVRPGVVHRDIYKSAEIFQLEMDRIFKGTWVFVGHQSEVSEPGDYRTLNIDTEPVIYVRDESGSPTVLVNRLSASGSHACQRALRSSGRGISIPMKRIDLINSVRPLPAFTFLL